MAQPPAYTPSTDFVGTSVQQPQFPGQQLAVEFSNIKTTTDALRSNLARIQRDDGPPANQSVGRDQLAADVLVKIDAATAATPTGLASSTNFAPRGSGVFIRTVEERLRDTIPVLDYIPPSLHAAIRARTDETDLSAYVQKAIDEAAIERRRVYAPGGQYYAAGLKLKANSGIVGDGQGMTTFKRPANVMNDVMQSDRLWELLNRRVSVDAVEGDTHIRTFGDIANIVKDTIIAFLMDGGGSHTVPHYCTVTDTPLALGGGEWSIAFTPAIPTGYVATKGNPWANYISDYGPYGVHLADLFIHGNRTALSVQVHDNVCQAQTRGSAGNLTLNGSMCVGGAAQFSYRMNFCPEIYCAANETARTFTIVGKQKTNLGDDVDRTVTISGGAAGTVVRSYIDFNTISEISVDGGLSGLVRVGVSDGPSAMNGITFFGPGLVMQDVAGEWCLGEGGRLEWNSFGFSNELVFQQARIERTDWHLNYGGGFRMNGPVDSRIDDLVSNWNWNFALKLDWLSAGAVVRFGHQCGSNDGTQFICPQHAVWCDADSATIFAQQAEEGLESQFFLRANNVNWNGGRLFWVNDATSQPYGVLIGDYDWPAASHYRIVAHSAYCAGGAVAFRNDGGHGSIDIVGYDRSTNVGVAASAGSSVVLTLTGNGGGSMFKVGNEILLTSTAGDVFSEVVTGVSGDDVTVATLSHDVGVGSKVYHGRSYSGTPNAVQPSDIRVWISGAYPERYTSLKLADSDGAVETYRARALDEVSVQRFRSADGDDLYWTVYVTPTEYSLYGPSGNKIAKFGSDLAYFAGEVGALAGGDSKALSTFRSADGATAWWKLAGQATQFDFYGPSSGNPLRLTDDTVYLLGKLNVSGLPTSAGTSGTVWVDTGASNVLKVVP